MDDYPFAENAVIVDLIGHDLLRAMWAVPVIAWFGFRFVCHLRVGETFRMTRAALSVVAGLIWIGHFAIKWVVPRSISIDVAALRADPAEVAALGGVGKLGYFDCHLRLGPDRSIDWSARKLYAWRETTGETWLWVEGNADESPAVAEALSAASAALAFPPPLASTIDAIAAGRRSPNRVPLIKRSCDREPAVVLVFHEPNGLVTPCLLLRLR